MADDPIELVTAALQSATNLDRTLEVIPSSASTSLRAQLAATASVFRKLLEFPADHWREARRACAH
jgi:hypothetical protein